MSLVAPSAGITPQVRRVSAGAFAGRYLSRLSRQPPWVFRYVVMLAGVRPAHLPGARPGRPREREAGRAPALVGSAGQVADPFDPRGPAPPASFTAVRIRLACVFASLMWLMGCGPQAADASMRFHPRIGPGMGLVAGRTQDFAAGPRTPVVYHGGAVMSGVTIHTVFWAPSGFRFDGPPGPGVLGYEPLIQRFFDGRSPGQRHLRQRLLAAVAVPRPRPSRLIPHLLCAGCRHGRRAGPVSGRAQAVRLPGGRRDLPHRHTAQDRARACDRRTRSRGEGGATIFGSSSCHRTLTSVWRPARVAPTTLPGITPSPTRVGELRSTRSSLTR